MNICELYWQARGLSKDLECIFLTYKPGLELEDCLD